MPPTDDQPEYAEEIAHDSTSLKRSSTMLASVESDSYPLFPQTRTEPGESTRKKQIAKFVLFTTLLTFLVIGRASVPENDVPCVIDKVQGLFEGVHSTILNSSLLSTSLLIMFSVFMDLVFLVTGLNWVLRGSSSRLLITTVLFYAIKVLIQPIWTVRTPIGYSWPDPGFPSLVVSYGSQPNEFYYSGYVGFLVICACEWKKNGNAVMARILRFGAVAATIILLAFYANYFIDIFGGAYFAHYLFLLVDEYTNPLDKAFSRIHNVVKGLITCE